MKLRQKVNQFCVVAGTTNASSMRIAKLEEALKKAKDEMKAHKKDMKYQKTQTRKAAKKPKSPKPAKTKRVKMTDEEKGQRRRERAVVKELEKAKGPKVQMNPLPAQAEPMMPAPAAPPSLAPAAPKGGRTRRRPVMRW